MRQMNIRSKWLIAGALLLSSHLAIGYANASELVYYPINPSFGGNPMNGPVLLNSALATNKHKDTSLDEDKFGITEQTPIEIFNETLERSIISRLASSASSLIMDNQGNFIPGNLQTDNFSISVADMGGGLLSITTIDRITGGSTTFEVNQR